MRADLEKIVWAAECHPKIRSWKFTLLNLCHHANTDGDSFPSIGTVARETGYSAKAVCDALAGLESMGIIRRSGQCGMRKRVTIYNITGIFTNVHNLANIEMGSCLQLSNSEVSSKKQPPNIELTSPNIELTSNRNILGNKEVSKLVCAAVNSEVTSPFVDKPRKTSGMPTSGGASPQRGAIAPSARNDGAVEPSEEKYRQLVKTPGWKPKSNNDRRFCMAHCYMLGASRDEAAKFIRFNAIRKWTCCNFGTVNDAAKEWVAKWCEDYPDDFHAERERRKRMDATRTLK